MEIFQKIKKLYFVYGIFLRLGTFKESNVSVEHIFHKKCPTRKSKFATTKILPEIYENVIENFPRKNRMLQKDHASLA